MKIFLNLINKLYECFTRNSHAGYEIPDSKNKTNKYQKEGVKSIKLLKCNLKLVKCKCLFYGQ